MSRPADAKTEWQELIETLEEALGGSAKTDQLVRAIIRRLGGCRVYIPVREPVNAKELRDLYDGTNRAELCERFGISERTFYRIMRGDRKHE